MQGDKHNYRFPQMYYRCLAEAKAKNRKQKKRKRNTQVQHRTPVKNKSGNVAALLQNQKGL